MVETMSFLKLLSSSIAFASTYGDPILQRSWSRVNNPAGVAKILSASVDEKKQVYDIKYVVGRSTHRGVLHKYLSPNSF